MSELTRADVVALRRWLSGCTVEDADDIVIRALAHIEAQDAAARAVVEWVGIVGLDGLCDWSGDQAGTSEDECGCDYCNLRATLLEEQAR